MVLHEAWGNEIREGRNKSEWRGKAGEGRGGMGGREVGWEVCARGETDERRRGGIGRRGDRGNKKEDWGGKRDSKRVESREKE